MGVHSSRKAVALAAEMEAHPCAPERKESIGPELIAILILVFCLSGTNPRCISPPDWWRL